MELLIAGILNLKYPTSKDSGYKLAIFVLIYALFTLFLYFFVICYLRRSGSVSSKFSGIFEHVRDLKFYGVFMARRAILVCVIFVFETSTF